jgi:lipopolysaccharide/colanic/teichoic acid biosynthesis glycosyltransferase
MTSALTTSSRPASHLDHHVELHLVSNVEVRSTVSTGSRLVMRAIDVVGALVLLVLFSPVMAVVAILVKRSSPGAIIFRQERIGKDGRLFDVFKFRSMAAGTDAQVLNDPELRRRYEQNNFKLDAADPRITRVGRVIRKTSLDEMPQLVNVLRGDMSLVGVRPLLARELALRSPYDQELYALHRPGLTGLWQVEGRSSVGHEDRADLDRRYLECWSAPANVGLLIRTPRAVLCGAGAH